MAGFVFASTGAPAQTVAASIIHHNIHSGGQAEAAADHIADLLEMTPQKGLVLCNEANNARQHFTLPYTDWHHVWRANPFEGRGNPTFVRAAVADLTASWVEEMDETWTYNDNDREPRIYTVVKCKLVANPWVEFHCVNVHFPPANSTNGPARQESINRLIALSGEMPVLPLIICGDFNLNEDDARERIAQPMGARLYSNANVDHIILRDGQSVGFETSVNVIRLGQFISDHQALRYNITFKQLPSQVSDWILY